MIRAVLVVLGLYLAYAGITFLLQRRLLFPGTFMAPYREIRPESMPGVEQLWLNNGHGRSEAWLIPAAADSDFGGAAGATDSGTGITTGARPGPALLFFHGNAEFIDDWLPPFRELADRGLHVLLVEYPGYGRSTGSPTRASTLAIATAAYDHLAHRDDVDPERIVVMGRSLGGGVAAELTRLRPAAALLLQSTFTSVGSLAARKYFLPPFLLRDRFPTLASLRAYDGPVLVLHGRRDRVVPHHHGRTLANASERASLVSMECGHNDCPPSWDDYWARITGFLAANGILGRTGHR